MTDSGRYWNDVASSSDGTKLAACITDGYIYISNDSGANWTPKHLVRHWGSIASSWDGTKLAACNCEFKSTGYIHISTDSGETWTQKGSDKKWNGIASSSDGTKLVAIVMPGQIYTMANNCFENTSSVSSQSSLNSSSSTP